MGRGRVEGGASTHVYGGPQQDLAVDGHEADPVLVVGPVQRELVVRHALQTHMHTQQQQQQCERVHQQQGGRAAHLGSLQGLLHAQCVVVRRQALHLLLARGLGGRQPRRRLHRALRLGRLRVCEYARAQVRGVVALPRADEASRHVDARRLRQPLHLRRLGGLGAGGA